MYSYYSYGRLLASLSRCLSSLTLHHGCRCWGHYDCWFHHPTTEFVFPGRHNLPPNNGMFTREQLLKIREQQDCIIQKEARVCVSNAFVIEDRTFNGVFFVEDEQVTEEADVIMWMVEWKGIVSWGYCGVKWLRKSFHVCVLRFIA